MPLSTAQIFIVVYSTTYLISVAALAISGIIVQGVHCDSTYNECNLSRTNSDYTWYPTQFINKTIEAQLKTQIDCDYHGKEHLSNNSWKLIPCYIDLDNIDEIIEYDTGICPNTHCNLFSVSESIFGAARWIFTVGLMGFGLILTAVLGYYGYFKLRDCLMRCRQQQQLTQHDYIAIHVESCDT